MDYNKSNFKTWDEAARWLQKHGYGLEQIRIEKELWDETAVSAKEAVAPVQTQKPMSKTIGKDVTETKVATTANTKTK